MKQKSSYAEFTKEEFRFLTSKTSRASMIIPENHLGSEFSDLLSHHPQQVDLPQSGKMATSLTNRIRLIFQEQGRKKVK